MALKSLSCYPNILLTRCSPGFSHDVRAQRLNVVRAKFCPNLTAGYPVTVHDCEVPGRELWVRYVRMLDSYPREKPGGHRKRNSG